MGGHKLRLGHAHGWTWGHGADVDVDYFATRCGTLIDWRDVLWFLVGVEKMVVVTVMSGGDRGRIRAAFDRPRAQRTLHSQREIFLVLHCPWQHRDDISC